MINKVWIVCQYSSLLLWKTLYECETWQLINITEVLKSMNKTATESASCWLLYLEVLYYELIRLYTHK